MPPRVVVTGIGAITASGKNIPEFRASLFQGIPSIRTLSLLPLDQLRITVGAEVTQFEPLDHFDAQELPLLDRFSQFAVIGAREAAEDAGLSEAEIGRSAAVIGTGCGGKTTYEEAYRKLYKEGRSRAHPLTIPKGMPSAAASQVSLQLGIQGPVFSVTSACSSAAHAIAQAAMMIENGLVDIAFAGGSDAPFTLGLMKSWEAMRVLAPDTCRPFAADRKGLVLGEGAGMLVLEAASHARLRGAKIHCELAGFGMSSDASHITNPSTEGAVRAMRNALEHASLAPDQIDYVNAHGTGTHANDISETQALHEVFGHHADSLPVSSTKSMHGHTLGAAGAIEAIATVLAIEQERVPPTINFTIPGPGCDLDYVPNSSREHKIIAAISNSFAFGGLNAVLVFKALEGSQVSTVLAR